ncbi:MAG: hypothetical protein GC180_09600 [Bacteroidetes bacterium]|nr:hypothetical protein [Bacteroidota bacterium]
MTAVWVVSAYLLLLLAGSFQHRKGNVDADSFLLAGRRLTLFPFVATMVTTAYGWIFGIGELYYQYGISAWLFLSLPYTIFAGIMAFFLSGKIRKEQIHSVPELLEKYYGKGFAKLGSLAVLITISPAMYALMCAQLLSSIFPIPIWISIMLALFFSSVYLYNGGLAALAKKDGWKFILMFGGFAVALGYLFIQYGPLPLKGMPAGSLKFSLHAHFWEVLSWFILASLLFADPGFHQRIYSTHNARTAQVGLFISILCWTFFDFLAGSVALYALGLMPELENSAFVYLALATSQLPEWIAALFILGLLATIMSTLDSFLFLSAQTLMLDLFNKKTETKKEMRKGLLLSSVLTFLILIPYQQESAVRIFYDFTPYIVCILVPPVLSIFIPSIKIQSRQLWVQVLVSILVCLIWNWAYSNNDEALSAVVPAILASIGIQAFFLLYNKSMSGMQN